MVTQMVLLPKSKGKMRRCKTPDDMSFEWGTDVCIVCESTRVCICVCVCVCVSKDCMWEYTCVYLCVCVWAKVGFRSGCPFSPVWGKTQVETLQGHKKGWRLQSVWCVKNAWWCKGQWSPSYTMYRKIMCQNVYGNCHDCLKIIFDVFKRLLYGTDSRFSIHFVPYFCVVSRFGIQSVPQ
jgi:hypothetical protein